VSPGTDAKAVNGHVVGDRVLVAPAGVARATARSVDTAARIGGGEFVIPMPETDTLAALRLAERPRAACSRAIGSGAARITCSVELVTFEHSPRDLLELLETADTLTYEAKAAGGDSVRRACLGVAGSTATEDRLLPFAHRSGA
jgi:diguanylate cyclase (GGDEF)-like protein